MKVIACVGGNNAKQPGNPCYNAMIEVNRLLGQQNDCRTITEEFEETSTETITKGIAETDGHVLPVEWRYGLYLGHLLEADGFIIAASHEPGTMIKLMAIIDFNSNGPWRKNPKRCAIINPSAKPIWGWDRNGGGMLNYLDTIEMMWPPIKSWLCCETTSPQEAVKWVLGNND